MTPPEVATGLVAPGRGRGLLDVHRNRYLLSLITRKEIQVRYRGSVLNDEITGAVIVYNNLTDVFTVDGQKAPASSAAVGDTPAPGGRVRAVLAPRDPPTGAAAPAKAPESPAPALRPSNTLGGGAK